MKKFIKRTTSVLLGLALVLQPLTVIPVGVSVAAEKSIVARSSMTAGSAEAQDDEKRSTSTGEYVSGQVIVKYRSDALKKAEDGVGKKVVSLKMARKHPKVASRFGASERALMSAKEAAKTVSAQTDILSEIGDYVIEDTIDFSDVIDGSDASVCSLISSDTLSTEELIDALSDNPDVISVTPNHIIRKESLPDYQMNDEYANYLTNLNTTAAVNTTGRQADNRGYSPETIPSINASCAWDRSDKLPAASSDKPVVAVIDTGIDTSHEDLQGLIWTNPGNIGLRGEHGYNFLDDSDVLIDDEGHGTHCAGIIAAQRNNGLGIAGVAGGLVDVMGLRILGHGDGAGKEFDYLAAFQYVLKAKSNGVNIVACNNSWGAIDNMYDDYEEIFSAMGEAGIIMVFAAGNESVDLDKRTCYPVCSFSDCVVRVGSVREDGNIASYSNYGNHSVDLFAQGNNIISSVSMDCFYPCIYSPERLRKTTSYYGEYSGTMNSGDFTPVLGDDGYSDYTGVGSFGKPVTVMSNGATASLSIGTSHALNVSKNPAVLYFTLRGVTPGSDCYLYYPYEKSRNDDGNNFDYSFGIVPVITDQSVSGKVSVGEVVTKKDGNTEIVGGVVEKKLGRAYDGLERHLFGKTASFNSVDRDDVSAYGIGIKVHIDKTTTGEITLAINHVAVSRGSVSGYYGKYDNYSGTSMAAPMAAGAAALLCCLEPEGSKAAGGAKGAKYVTYIKNRLFSLTRHSTQLEGKCLSEGYLDFSLLDGKQPVISDVRVDTDKNTIKLLGSNLSSAGTSKIVYKRLLNAEDGYKDISGQATWAKDGTSVTINKAGSLIGTYTRFMVTHDGGSGTGAFFLVKGEKPYEKVLDVLGDDGCMITDSKKKRAIFMDTIAEMYEWDEKKGFKHVKQRKSETLQNRINDSLGDFFTSVETIYSNPETIKTEHIKTLTIGDTIYRFVYIEARAEKQIVLATLDLNRKKIVTIKKKDKKTKRIKKIKKKVFQYHWELQPIDGLEHYGEVFAVGKNLYALADNTYAENPDELDKNVYCLKKGVWKPTGVMIPEDYYLTHAVGYKNKAYFMCGMALSEDTSEDEVKMSPSIYRFDGKKFTKMKTKFPATLRYYNLSSGKIGVHPALTEGSKGIAIYGMSMDGYGNTVIYDPEKDKLKAVPSTIEPGIASGYMLSSVWTTKGFFVMRRKVYCGNFYVFDIFRLKI